MENEIQEAMIEHPQHGMVNFEDYAMQTEAVLRQVNIIQDLMGAVMQKNQHYGLIPGCANPSLYKAGAEKLGLTFRLRPEYETVQKDLDGGHRDIEVVCTLYHIPTGQSVGQGVGSCTTMEGKYRFRGGEKKGTGRPIPKEYWNLKKDGNSQKAQAVIGGPGFSPGKVGGAWEICEVGEKIEHDNPADFYNTVLKMAKKRAHVDAILTATAASDIFTQDVEDMPEVFSATKETPKQAKPPLKQPGKKKDVKIQTIETTVFDMEQKNGETNGKAWTRYGIIAEDRTIYGTFSELFADLAATAVKEKALVKITFKVEDKYNTVTDFEIIEAAS
ncbi:MAG: hypothetical protein SV375_23280 [Thermodesulfobacteriota bacterium]|nr:hypothetical protein [Thermodesulfobacteriota bacterium]